MVKNNKTGGAGLESLTRVVVTEIQADGTILQSLDLSSLKFTKELAPELLLVALSSGDAGMGVGEPDASAILGRIDDYDGSLPKAAAA